MRRKTESFDLNSIGQTLQYILVSIHISGRPYEWSGARMKYADVTVDEL